MKILCLLFICLALGNEITRDNTIVLVTGHNYKRWWTHLASQLNSFNLLDITKFVAGNETDCIPNTHCEVDGSAWTAELQQQFSSPQGIYGVSAASKWYWMRQLARTGYNVLYLDSDVAFLNDPLDLLRSDFDIASLSDLLEDRPGCHNHAVGPCASSGIVAVHPNQKSISLLSTMVYELGRSNDWEQDVFNRLIGRSHDLNFRLFDNWQAANCRIFRHHLLEDPVRAKQQITVIHLGYVQREHKEPIFRQYGVFRETIDANNSLVSVDTNICSPNGIWAYPK